MSVVFTRCLQVHQASVFPPCCTSKAGADSLLLLRNNTRLCMIRSGDINRPLTLEYDFVLLPLGGDGIDAASVHAASFFMNF